jgi:hypothetical protein
VKKEEWTMRTTAIRAVCAASVVFGAVEPSRAERNLKERIELAEAQWLIGTWVHQDPYGGIVRLVFSWELGHHAIIDHVVAPGRESRGISALDPVSQQLEYFGVDDRGGLATGTWCIDSDKWTLKGEARLPDGSQIKVVSIHSREGIHSMKLEVYRLGTQGELVTPPFLTRHYERRE